MSTLTSSVNTLQLFAEPTRVRLMALLEEQELTVAELVNITELAQSSVSTHLGKLRDAGFLRDRRVGASTLYSLNDGNLRGSGGSCHKLYAPFGLASAHARLFNCSGVERGGPSSNS